jgi:hypothetical protein
MIGRLNHLRSRLNKGRVADAFSHIRQMRNKRLAHFDYVDGQSLTTMENRHIRICLINEGKIVDLLCRILIQ